MLKSRGAESVGGVFHCFSGDIDFAKKLFDLNFIVSIPGNVTYKKATTLKEVATWIPLDKLMIETDAPYLSPIPYRGKRNESSYVAHVAECIAELRGTSPEAIADATTNTAITFFNLPS